MLAHRVSDKKSVSGFMNNISEKDLSHEYSSN